MPTDLRAPGGRLRLLPRSLREVAPRRKNQDEPDLLRHCNEIAEEKDRVRLPRASAVLAQDAFLLAIDHVVQERLRRLDLMVPTAQATFARMPCEKCNPI